MSDHPTRHEPQSWEQLSPEQVIELLVYELYSPVSLLGSQLRRLTEDDDPLSEEEYEAIFAQMDHAVRQLSKTVVHLKRYSEERKRL
ncbi:MAG: hypothetical protein OHK0015_47790 [Chloroflexi bacterium OHK40]